MAKLPKWPKKPKKSASVAVHQKYLERVKAVAAKRKQIQDAPKKKNSIASQADKIRMKG